MFLQDPAVVSCGLALVKNNIFIEKCKFSFMTLPFQNQFPHDMSQFLTGETFQRSILWFQDLTMIIAAINISTWRFFYKIISLSFCKGVSVNHQ